MEITFAHLCDYASVSADGKLSISGIFDKINAPKMPWLHPSFYLAFQLESSFDERNARVPLRVECVDADGARVLQLEAQYSPGGSGEVGEALRQSQMLAFHNLPFGRAGRFEFIIYVDGTLKRRVPFDVVSVAPPK